MTEKLKRTPLYDCHLKLKARMVPFAGYEMPVQYSGFIEETETVRKTGGLFDVSHMGQFRITGKKAIDEVQKLVTNDLAKLPVGKAQYNALCFEHGGTIDDLVIYRPGEEELYVCANASNLDRDFEWFRTHLDKTVPWLTKAMTPPSSLSKGPMLKNSFAPHGDAALIQSIPYYGAKPVTVMGKSLYLARTGYTGEDGFELYAKKEDAATLWETILEDGKQHGILPIGLGARDTLRLEMGYALYGHELNDHTSPIAAGQGWIVKTKKSTPFIGQEALRKERENGPEKKLHAFIIEDKRIARQGYPILNEKGENVGEIVSGTLSPHLGKPIALGFVNKGHTEQPRYQIQVRSARVVATRAELPFVKSSVKK